METVTVRNARFKTPTVRSFSVEVVADEHHAIEREPRESRKRGPFLAVQAGTSGEKCRPVDRSWYRNNASWIAVEPGEFESEAIDGMHIQASPVPGATTSHYRPALRVDAVPQAGRCSATVVAVAAAR